MRARGLLTILVTMALAFGALDVPAAVKTEAVNCTHAVRQGTRQLSLVGGCEKLPGEPLGPLTGAAENTGGGARAAACEAQARELTTNPGSIRQSFTIKTGSGAVIGTRSSRLECEKATLERLRADGATRVTGGNVNTCQVVTSYSTATGTATCVSTTSYIVSYMANASCPAMPSPNVRPMTCPSGQSGAWAQTATQAPYPACTVTWAPSEPRPGDCWTPDTLAALSWTPPTRNTDGSTLTNLSGFRVHYGRRATEQTQTVQIDDPRRARYVITDLPAGTWFFSVRAFTPNAESNPSSTAQKTITR